MKPGNDLTFQVGGGELTLFGHVDVSVDYQTNGMSGYKNGGQTVTGNNGWLSDVSSNLSFFGIRGERPINSDLKALFQFETEVAYAATPGASDQAPDGTAQKFSLGSRNSYVGSPGQNRSTNTGLYAQGEPNCTGSNSSAGLNGNAGQPTSCADGSFGTAYSVALTYEAGPLYVTGGYELHKSVNRIGDETVAGTIGIRDESAYKLGVRYTLPTRTTVNLIAERLQRNAITPALDERTHTATWLAVTQGLTNYDDLNFGWAHAFRTPGQPDQGVQDKFGNGATPGPSNNGASLFSIGYKHRFLDKRTTAYVTCSRLANGYWGHYSLGAGGHGLPTRNYVGDKFIGGCQDGGVCGPPFAGNTDQALSVGLTYDF